MWWNEQSESKSLPAGQHQAVIAFAKLDNTGAEPKISLKYEVEGEGDIWQNFTFNDKSAKYLSWQMGVLGASKYVREMAAKTPDRPLTQDIAATLAFNYLDGIKAHKKWDITVTESEYMGKPQKKVIVDGEVQEEVPF